jgi:tRNA(adenine34) deaminase
VNSATDEKWMTIALDEARLARIEGEVPVGAVAVLNGEILARNHNRIEQDFDASAHAEMLVLRKSAQLIKNWRLTGVTVYVTVEPCPMCAMALVLFRVDRVVFGAREPRTGGVASFVHLLGNPLLNHAPEISENVLSEESAHLLRAFFKSRRSNGI